MVKKETFYKPKIFLSAEWRKLIMVNYTINPALLSHYLPSKTEIDLWKGLCYVSLVGFRFLDTKVKGIKIPFHVNFEEINLRFYVRHKSDTGEWKRGVVFIKEIVPLPLLAFVANTFYKEKYESMTTDHRWTSGEDFISVAYRWKQKNWHILSVKAVKEQAEIKSGTEEEFITEHYWGYTKINDRRTFEYAVEHPRWNIYKVNTFNLDVNYRMVYGKDFAFLNNENPVSVYLAEGSPVIVREATTI